MKLLRILFKTTFLVFCIGLIVFGIGNIFCRNQEIEAMQDISSKYETNISIDNEGGNLGTVRTRDPFSTDYGSEYYWGLDDNIDLDIETKEATTLNKSKTGNYYMEVDFNAIKKEHPNVIAYLKVNGTNVEYPIVQGEDDSYYLKHDLDNNPSSIGWPYMDSESDYNSMVGNIVLYGHNIKNKTMFGELTKLLNNKKWFEEPSNSEIYLVTENKTYVYKIFSVYNSSPLFNYFKADFKDSNELNNFIKVVKNKNKSSSLNTNFIANQILTLSTCYNSGRQRLVVQAYLERSKIIE